MLLSPSALSSQLEVSPLLMPPQSGRVCVCASAPLSLPPSSLQQHPALNAEGWGLASLCALLVVSWYAPISNMYSDVSQEYQDALFLQKINGV